jgi:hypothetical protein
LEVNTNLLFPLTLSWELPSGFSATGANQINQLGDYFFYFDAPVGAAPGEYLLTLNMTAQNGQVYSKVLRVNVQAESASGDFSLIAPAQNANPEGNPVSFEWTASAGANYYVWTMATDANFLQNVQTQNTTNTSLSLNAMESGLHYWKVEAINDCGSSKIEVGQFDLLSTGTEEVIISKVQLYPNPTQSVLYFSKPLNNFQVIDITGRIVFANQGAAIKQMSTENLSDGIYWLKINEDVKSFEVHH